MVSRQREYQKRMKAAGRCESCGQHRNGANRTYCQRCAETQRILQRRRAGYRPWRFGGRGRPPSWAYMMFDGLGI